MTLTSVVEAVTLTVFDQGIIDVFNIVITDLNTLLVTFDLHFSRFDV